MKHQDFATGLLAAAVAVLASADALAAPPQRCRSGDGKSGFDQGYELQQRSLRNSFKRHFSCNSVESFIGAVNIDFPGSASSDGFLQCRDIGIIHAQNETIRSIASDCNVQCTDSGDSMGTSAARQYCRIQEVLTTVPLIAEKMEISAVPPPLPTCKIATEQACRAAFVGFVNRHPDCKEQADSDADYMKSIDDSCGLVH